MHISRTFIPNLLSLSVLAALQSAHAATPVEVDNTLPVTVVTASRSAEAINLVPASITVIGKDQIQQSAASDVPSLLSSDAALNVVSLGGAGQQTSIFTRGTNSNQTLVLLDGVSVNNTTSSLPSVNFLDTSDINQIEILKGPASVLYGSDAIGGVIQLISSKPTQQKLFTTVEAGENGLYKAIVGADLVKDDLYLQVRGQKLATDGTPVTTVAKQDSGYDQKGYAVKAGVDNSNYALSVEARSNQGTSEYVGFDYSSPRSEDFNNRLLSLKGRVTVAPDININLRLSQYLDELDQNNSSDFVHSDNREADLNVRWAFTTHQNLIAGVTLNEANARALSTSYTGAQTSFDHDIRSTGYYVQHQYQEGIFSTQAGIRVEDNQDFGTHTTGQIASRVQILPQTSVYANIGSAFRAPNAFERYSNSASSLSNPDLKPEVSTSYELGVNQNIAHGLDGHLSVYRTNTKNLIAGVFDPVTYISQYQNINKAKLTGAETGLKLKLDNGWFVSGNYDYVQPIAEGQNGAPDSELLRRPRQSVTGAAGLQLAQYGFSAEIVAKSRAKDYSPAYPTPGYAIANLHGYWQVQRNVRVFANIENVTDRKYPTALAGAPFGGFGTLSHYIAPGRQATLGVTLSY